MQDADIEIREEPDYVVNFQKLSESKGGYEVVGKYGCGSYGGYGMEKIAETSNSSSHDDSYF
jgi:hypothetical protein